MESDGDNDDDDGYHRMLHTPMSAGQDVFILAVLSFALFAMLSICAIKLPFGLLRYSLHDHSYHLLSALSLLATFSSSLSLLHNHHNLNGHISCQGQHRCASPQIVNFYNIKFNTMLTFRKCSLFIFISICL